MTPSPIPDSATIKPSHEALVTTIRNGWFWVEDDGIIRAVLRADVAPTLESSREMIALYRELAEGRPARILCDPAAARRSTPEVRRYLVSPESVAVHGAMAFVIRSPVARLLVSAWIRLETPPYPTRLVGPNEIESALAWLKSYPVDSH